MAACPAAPDPPPRAALPRHRAVLGLTFCNKAKPKLGTWWYGMFAVAPSAELLATVIGAFAVVGALFAVFSGILTDPLQRFIGLHRRRLLRLIDALEDLLCGDGEGRFPLRDHYVARLIDLLDLSAALLRTVRA